ncbi:MAG: hypothetical protein VKL59_05925 [Nostocaceae cyanobacterium]|nr:hypothetical protein [Nostocaceae cyanobacterium]
MKPKKRQFEKFIYLFCSLIIFTAGTVIFFKEYVGIFLIIGFTFLGLGIYLSLKKLRIKLDRGNYNELIQGNYIEGDYINIQNSRINISQDVTKIIDEFREILTKLNNQGYSAEEAITTIANEVAREFHSNHEIMRKLTNKLLIDKNTDEEEAANELVNLLIRHSYLFDNQVLRSQIFNNDDDYEDVVDYKGYTINLEKDKSDWWHYKIEGGFIIDNTGESFSKYIAIDEAKGKIDEQRFRKLRSPRFKSDDDYEDVVDYKGYTINLEKDNNDWWHYKINGGFITNCTGESLSKYLAIKEAQEKIDEERFRNW